MPPGKSSRRLFGPRTIAARLTLTFFIAGLSITVLAAFLVESLLRARLESDASSRFEHYANLVATKLSRDRAERVQDLQRIAAHALLANGQAGPAALRDYLEANREELGLAWLAAVNPAGQVIAASGGH